MATMLEREIKLPFPGPAAARAAMLAAGARPERERRLQRDCLLDTPDGLLRRSRSALRLRTETGRSLLTFKGPVLPSTMKLREEIETVVGDTELALGILERVGFKVWFRCEKYREEFSIGTLIAAVDETPVGTFVELEGTELDITAAAKALGYGPGDYVLDSYRGLFARHCQERGLTLTHMLFDGA